VAWTEEDDATLMAAVQSQSQEEEGMDEHDVDWDAIAESLASKTPVQCLQRYLVLKQERPMPPPPPGGGGGGATTDISATGEEESAKPAAKGGFQTSAKNGEDGDGEDDDEDGDTTGDEGGTGSDSESNWTKEESALLKKLVEQYQDTAPRWNEIAANFTDRTAIDCLSHWQTLTNPPSIKGKGSWTAEEDAVLKAKRALYGRKWAKIASFLPGRLGKQCRERFVNHLDPELKKGDWTGTFRLAPHGSVLRSTFGPTPRSSLVALSSVISP
jgi:hypothetical protein